MTKHVYKVEINEMQNEDSRQCAVPVDAEDAARYRCLRDGEWNKALPNGRIGLITGNFGEDLDAAIDAARKAT